MYVYELLEKLKKDARTTNKEESAINFLFSEYFQVGSLIEINQNILTPQDIKTISKIASKYIYKNIPIQYLLKTAYFYNLKLYVDKRVLIPRFDTEVIVSKCLEIIKTNNLQTVIDIGTGSGAIALAIKSNNRDVLVDGVDKSKKALRVSQRNRKDIKVNFFYSDILNKVNGQYDLIVSNPPYLANKQEMDYIVYKNEPRQALISKQPLYFYQQILIQSKKVKPRYIIFEIPSNRLEQINDLIKSIYPTSTIETIYDLANRPRGILIKLPLEV